MRIGPYETLAEIGRGGMGVVYGARGPEGGEVAIKVLTEIGDPEAVAGFEREKRLLWSLGESEGFVPVLDAGVDAGRPYLVMPLVPGGTLKERLAKDPLKLEEALVLVRQLTWAIARAHERGIVHRDLKPGNVLFAKAGRPLVADLGLAKHFRRDVLGASKTRSLSVTGVITGTPGYMAPEQIQDGKRAGPAADVFALGVILHQCLTGVRPFEGVGLPGYVDALRSGPAKPLRELRPDMPRWLDAVLARALARDPRERFTDALALLRALEAPSRTRSRLLVVVGAVSLLLLVVAGAVIRRERPSTIAASRGSPVAPHRGAEAPPRSSPEEAKKALERGDEKRLAEDYTGAIADYTRAITLDPKNVIARVKRADASRRAERYDGPEGALEDYTKAIELDPRCADAWGGRGWSKAAKDDLTGAIADFTKAIEYAPENAQDWQGRGSAKASEDEYDGALEDLTRSIELDPSAALAWENRGFVKGRRGDLDGAIADLDRAIELDPGLLLAWADRGDVKVVRHDVDGAIADYERCLSLGPNHENALRIRGELAKLRAQRAR